MLKKLIYFVALGIFLVSLYLGLLGRIFNMTHGFLMVLIILSPCFIYNYSRYLKNHYNENLVITFQSLAAISFAMSGLGTLFLNSASFEYDSFQHFFVTILFGIGISIIISLIFKKKSLNLDKFKISFLTVCLTLILSTFIWESYQYFGDQIFGTEMYGQKGQPLDTFYDCVTDILSLPLTVVFIYRYLDKFLKWISPVEKI